MIMTILFALAASADPASRTETTIAANAPTAQPAAANAPKERRYCVDQIATGSILATRVCRTRADWKALGVDVGKR